MVIDASVEVRLGGDWQASFRPWFRKARPTTPTGDQPPWDAQLYQAGVRYERPARWQCGWTPARSCRRSGWGFSSGGANLNPTIAPHLSNVVSMPVFDPTVPRQVPCRKPTRSAR
jgi:hypothetical protein